MEFIVLDLNTATEDQIKAAIDCNNRTSRLMNSEIDKLRRVAESAKKSKKTFLFSKGWSVDKRQKILEIWKKYEFLLTKGNKCDLLM